MPTSAHTMFSRFSTLRIFSLVFASAWLFSGVHGEFPPAGRIILIPLDDRPAVGQFAQMIGAIADHEVRMPPRELLGRFTAPGSPDRLQEWLKSQDYSKVDALIVSIDMLAYGGLVASRSHQFPEQKALESLGFFRWFRRNHPRTPVYAFSVLMRVAPTAEAASRPWRENLARWAELKDRVPKTRDAKMADELARLEKALDPVVVDNYLAARKRDLHINLAALELAGNRTIDSLVLLQDDAREYGLHRQDQEVLHRRLVELKLEPTVPIYNGADEGSLALVSRAIIDKYHRPIHVQVIYSSEKSRDIIAPFEDHPLHFTVENQIRAAGGIPVAEGQDADYMLYVNAPQTDSAAFERFLARMIIDLKSGNSVALADVLFPPPHYSGADERIIRVLEKEKLFDRFAGYAAWNTAGNALGTAIPQANMLVLLQSRLNNAPERAARGLVAHLAFLMHRFVGDYIYHDIVRFDINRRLREGTMDPTDEFTPEMYDRINQMTRGQLSPRIEKFFSEYFDGRSYPLQAPRPKQFMKITGLRALDVRLPWPRTFEVAVEYKMDYSITKR